VVRCSSSRWLKTFAGCVAACASAAGCANGAARVASGVPTDLAGTAPAGLGTPRPVPVNAAYDGAYAGTLAPGTGNLPTCGAAPDGLSRTMLVANGHATFGVNLPFEGNVEPNGSVTMRYLNLGQVNGRFADGAFAGVLRTGGAGSCRWAVELAKAEPVRESLAGQSPAPDLVPGPQSLLNQGTVPDAAAVHPRTTGACSPASLENCR
jgi:hypothetical protein